MRHPSILDVVRAITNIAANHPRVTTWWYAPNPRFRLRGEVGKSLAEPTPLEVVVQTTSGDTVDYSAIAADVSRQFSNHPVTARPHQGADEKRLFRVLSVERPARADR